MYDWKLIILIAVCLANLDCKLIFANKYWIKETFFSPYQSMTLNKMFLVLLAEEEEDDDDEGGGRGKRGSQMKDYFV